MKMWILEQPNDVFSLQECKQRIDLSFTLGIQTP